MIPKECFQTFISAVFYVGKGKRSRPYSHLYEALEYFKGDKTSKVRCFFYLVILFYFRDLPYFIPKLEIHPSVPQLYFLHKNNNIVNYFY